MPDGGRGPAAGKRQPFDRQYRRPRVSIPTRACGKPSSRASKSSSCLRGDAREFLGYLKQKAEPLIAGADLRQQLARLQFEDLEVWEKAKAWASETRAEGSAEVRTRRSMLRTSSVRVGLPGRAALCSKGSGSRWTRRPRWRQWSRRMTSPPTGPSRRSSSLPRRRRSTPRPIGSTRPGSTGCSR